MREQKGGDMTINGRRFTAQDILDKFSATYFDKSTIQINSRIHGDLKEFKDLASQGKYYQWFDVSKRLGLEDQYLNFEGIESRIAHHAIRLTKVNMQGDPIITMPLATYDIRKNDGNLVPAYYPSLQKTAETVNGTKRWRLFVKDAEMNPIDTGIEKLTRTHDEAIRKIILENVVLEDPAPNFHSGFTERTGGFPIPPANTNIYQAMAKSAKLLYFKENQQLFVYYAEINSSNPNEVLFHPHNLVNFIPRSDIEERIKDLFQTIANKLQSLLAACDDYKYKILPDNFYHIHVTELPGEEDILLTIHAAYEDFSRPDLKKYTYINKNKKSYKMKRINAPLFRPTMNMPSSSPTQQMLDYRKYRRRHNAFILLKNGASEHPFYTLSNKSQVGNPFMFPPGFFYEGQLTQVGAFGMSEAMIGNKLFDINHISGKGVYFSKVEEKCMVFCDSISADTSAAHKQIFTNLLINPALSTPITEAQILPHMQSVRGYSTSPIAPAPVAPAPVGVQAAEARVSRYHARYPRLSLEKVREIISTIPNSNAAMLRTMLSSAQDEVILNTYRRNYPFISRSNITRIMETANTNNNMARAMLNTHPSTMSFRQRVTNFRRNFPAISEQNIRQTLLDNPDSDNDTITAILMSLAGGHRDATKRNRRRRVRRTRNQKRN